MIGEQVVLDNVGFDRPGSSMFFDATFDSGTITAIIGPSGAGKSTLLNLVAGFETPTSGRVRIGDRDVTGLSPAERPVSMVFQDNNLFTHLTVETNIALGIRPRISRQPGDRETISEALERVGLTGFEKRLPGELSGGERQRVAIARAWLRRKPVLLLDEPFAALGPKLRRDMLHLIRTLQAETGMTTVLVTHQPDEAAGFAEKIVFIDAGKTIAHGPAQQFLSRTDVPGLAEYLGR
ncbi:MAG: thiamine ABC transporter ATP-binding protein [Alphaproteobacteria bacterium]|nr:thiamine ABC transporter ATP-binding protein [Alphaproteobacteria bacterium]